MIDAYLSKLTPNVIVQGPLLPEPVKIAMVQVFGNALKLIGQGLRTGQFYDPSFTPDQLALLEIVTEASYDGDPVKFRLGLEALRLQLAYEYDPYFSLSIARIDPLPHQLEAVYEYFLKLPRIRFLLADDPGAGYVRFVHKLIQISQAVAPETVHHFRGLTGQHTDPDSDDTIKSLSDRQEAMFQTVLTTLQVQGYPVQIGFFSFPKETRDLEAYFPAEYYPKTAAQPTSTTV